MGRAEAGRCNLCGVLQVLKGLATTGEKKSRPGGRLTRSGRGSPSGGKEPGMTEEAVESNPTTPGIPRGSIARVSLPIFFRDLHLSDSGGNWPNGQYTESPRLGGNGHDYIDGLARRGAVRGAVSSVGPLIQISGGRYHHNDDYGIFIRRANAREMPQNRGFSTPLVTNSSAS